MATDNLVEHMIGFHKWMLENDVPAKAEQFFHYTDEDMANEYLKEVVKVCEYSGLRSVQGYSLEDIVVSDEPAESWMDEYKNDYQRLVTSGMFWEFHPTWTGEWEKDKWAFCYDKKK